MHKQINLACACGAVKGTLNIVPNSFFHVHCLCADCQRFAENLGNEDKILDEHGGSELFQTYPKYMTFNEGEEQIACMQLHTKGLFRWHTKCCNMPLANTMNSANVPFVGISIKLMQFESEQEKLKTLGPVLMKAFGKSCRGEKPADVHDKFPLSFMPKILFFMLKGMLGKKNKPHPFFKDKKPVVKAKLMR